MAGKSEYLKKYLSDGQDADKKKKRRKKLKEVPGKIPRSRLIDDDVDFKSLLPENLSNTLEDDIGDNDPIVADFIDERPKHVQLLEQYRQDDRWKLMGNKGKESKESTIRKQHDSDSDQSSTRTRGSSDFDQSSTRRGRHDSRSDQSPPRRERHDSDSDQSPPRRKRHDSDSDQSPPRKKRHDSDSDQSPPRRKRHNSDSDQSPPRRKRHNSDSDLSPPRRKRHNSDSDQSPPRRKRHDSDQSPPRKQKRSVNSDQSPPRKKHQGSKKHKGESSPGKFHSKSDKRKKKTDAHSSRKSRWGSEEKVIVKQEPGATSQDCGGLVDGQNRPMKTLGGATAGLSSAAQMKHEAQLIKDRQSTLYNQVDDETLGRNAKTVFRESGRKRDRKEKEPTAEELAKQAEREDKYKSWNKGLKQSEIQNEALQEALHEMNKPLTRRADDQDLEEHLKAQEREGDPMLAFIKKKKTTKDSNKKERPHYTGKQPPPNRFHIWPGYRWDGVDRSNGFEKKMVAKTAERKAGKEEAYKWSVEDM